MTNLYLIAHKVSGEPAFDIATQMECPECHGSGAYLFGDEAEERPCSECEAGGYWWIIPTSGHRAHPWWHWNMEATELAGGRGDNLIEMAGEMPPGLPDHYLYSRSPHEIKTRIEDLIATLLPSPPTKPFKTRRL